MAIIPSPMNTTAEAIVRWWDSRPDEQRPYLGASEIGKPCKRALWYGFRWATARRFPGRMKRLFDRGHREELLFIEELRAIGVEVYEHDPDTKNQHRFVAVKGHFAGHADAIGRGLPEAPKTWAILEFKTFNDRTFKELLGKGVRDAKPQHYAQMQVYMGLAELDRALYLAVNKDDDTLYSEWVHFDQVEFDKLIAKASEIIGADEPPARISEDPAWWECKFCEHHSTCHGEQVPSKNCRTCVHASPIDNGQWDCVGQDRLLPEEEQRLGCRQHLFIPSLIRWAEPLDAGNDWIMYRDRDSGLVFANVTDDCDRELMPNAIVHCVTSQEWPVAIRKVINSQLAAQIKGEFPDARIVGSSATEDDDIPF